MSHAYGQGTPQFEALLEATPEAVVLTNRTGEIVLVNSQTERVFAYARKELFGQQIEMLLPERFHARHSKHRTQYALAPHARPMGAGFELYGLKKSGVEFPVEISLNQMDAEAGSLIISVIRDVTVRKEAEARLRSTLQELADFKAALDAHAILAVTDPQGRITYANDKFCQISKYSREALLGQDHRILNSGYHSQEFMRDLWTTIASGKVWQGEIRNRARDGSLYWVHATIVPFLDAQGAPQQYVAIRTEITQRKRAEEDRERLITELKQALAQVKTLKGMLPICSYCKKVRDGQGYWRQLEAYLSTHSEAELSHGLCPDCAIKQFEDLGMAVPDSVREAADRERLGRSPKFRNG